MWAKIIGCLVVAFTHCLIAFFGIATMLLAMNGYNDRAAEAAIPAYIISQVVVGLISITLVFLSIWVFQDKLKWNVFGSAILSIIIGIFISVILTVVAIGIGISFGDRAFRG